MHLIWIITNWILKTYIGIHWLLRTEDVIRSEFSRICILKISNLRKRSESIIYEVISVLLMPRDLCNLYISYKEKFILKDLRKEIIFVLRCKPDSICCSLLLIALIFFVFRFSILCDLYGYIKTGHIERLIEALCTPVFMIQCFAFSVSFCFESIYSSI